MGRENYNIINDMAEVLNASQMQKLKFSGITAITYVLREEIVKMHIHYKCIECAMHV